MFPLGTALDQSGAARFLAEGLVASVGPLGPTAVMLALLLLTFLATCFIPTAALVLILAPIILNASQQMAISPYGWMMAMAMAASASFMTPISHPANILVMGPGGNNPCGNSNTAGAESDLAHALPNFPSQLPDGGTQRLECPGKESH